MPRSLAVALVLLAAACNFSQDFQVPAEGSGPGAGGTCGSASDSANCGTCGHSCLGGACSYGKCVPVVLASEQGDSAYGAYWYPYTTDIGDALVGPDRIAVDGTHVYWLNLRGEVMRVATSGGDAQRVAQTAATPIWIGLDGAFIYFSTLEARIFRVAKAGGTPVALADVSASMFSTSVGSMRPYPFEFMLSGGQIYWASGMGIDACAVSNCAQTRDAIYPGTAEYRPFSFAIDSGGHMYGSVENHRSEGPSSESVDYAMTFFRDGQWLGNASSMGFYELHGAENGVYAFATTDFGGPTGVVRWTESSVTFLASGDTLPGAPRGLALDDEFVYWANAAANVIARDERVASIVRCRKTGCASPEVLVDGQMTPRAVAVANGAVYWTTGDGKVMKLATPEGLPQKPLR